MKSGNLMIIDPSLEIPEIESYNEISLCSPLKTTYHLPEIHSPKTMTNGYEYIYNVAEIKKNVYKRLKFWTINN